MRAGGRLVYVGAGSSGLIAALDASECEATFSTPPGLVVALVAGDAGGAPLTRALAEDDRDAGARDVGDLTIRPVDVVVGISASGSTPYVLGALDAAVTAGALTVCVVCAPGSTVGAMVDHEIVVVVGPEFIAGSTRLKAGTAQKLVLNATSTITMIRLGKTYGNLMVDVVAANEKLVERVRRIVAAATGATREEIDEALTAANGDARVAIVCLVAGVDADTARARLEVSGRASARRSRRRHEARGRSGARRRAARPGRPRGDRRPGRRLRAVLAQRARHRRARVRRPPGQRLRRRRLPGR
jgi:N-acetylmuramic acid 6-phosphate etherase